MFLKTVKNAEAQLYILSLEMLFKEKSPQAVNNLLIRNLLNNISDKILYKKWCFTKISTFIYLKEIQNKVIFL